MRDFLIHGKLVAYYTEQIEIYYPMKDSEKSRVTVIVPAYNSEKTIAKCLRSILNQSYRDLEVIVVDDGSIDSTSDLVRRMADKDSRIHLFYQENAGTSAARNLGIDQASGEYLTFVDSDDYIARDYIERLQKRCESTGADMVICGLCFVGEDGNIQKKLVPDYYERGTHEEWTFRISAVCSHFYRREIWEEYGVRFSVGERGEDMPVALFFSAVCRKIAVLPYAGYAYVQHKSSAMSGFRGLRKWNLPTRSLEEMIRKAEETGIRNDRKWFELFIMRILCTCFFDLARGADRKKLRELADYIVRIVDTYLPDYRENEKLALFSDVDSPFSQQAAVSLLRFLVRTRLIYLAADLLAII